MSELILPDHLKMKEPVEPIVKLKISLKWRDPPLSKDEEIRRQVIQKAMNAEASKMEDTIKEMVKGQLLKPS